MSNTVTQRRLTCEHGSWSKSPSSSLSSIWCDVCEDMVECEFREVYVWEVHLCHSMVSDSPDDECLIVAATDRKNAIDEARRVSRHNPPQVGPVYKENGESLDVCENSDRYV